MSQGEMNMSHLGTWRNSLSLVILALFACAMAVAAAQGAETLGSQRRVSFNDGWRFSKGEFEGAQQPAFNDSGWRQVRLPHDWAIEGPFDQKYTSNSGGLPFFGVAWYRKTFTLPGSAKGKFFSIEFDGAMSNAHVWLNGQDLGERPYGYISFAMDLTPHLRFGGQPNVIAVRLAPEDQSSRWYPGAGIYRNVWLTATAARHVAHWGTYVTTPQVSDAKATVAVKTEILNRGQAQAGVTLRSTILSPAGQQVSRQQDRLSIPAGGSQTASTTLSVARPQRWEVDQPNLYRLVSEVMEGGTVVDRYETPFGIRATEFSATKGFLLNGRTLKMKGVCMHHDLGALGTAVNRRATERQLQILKSMGVNAIRTSHNPPSPELLELCDRLGLLVMDEAYDMWKTPKVRNGSSKFWDQWGEIDLRDMVRRDRNHPSVIMWSIGNEIPEQGRPDGAAISKRLADICHQEDPTRPVTAGLNNPDQAMRNGLANTLDLQGYNYKPHLYEQTMKEHPDWVFFGSETASTVSSRGVYHLPLERYQRKDDLQVTSYDIIAPSWATQPDVEFEAQDKLPNVMGEFVWTGFDYLGEPTPYGPSGRGGVNTNWPSRSSYFGIVDLAGFPKDRYYLYQSVWTSTPMVHALPHWNWTGMEGKPIPVMVYTNCDEVELFVNGNSLGRKKRFGDPVTFPVGQNVSRDGKFTSKYRLMWEVPYAPGSLRVVGYKDGKQASVHEIKTAGAPARVSLQADRSRIRADGDDLSFITVRVEDKDGNICPLADNLVKFALAGPGEIAAVDNGNAATTEPFQADFRKAFNGLALLVVRSKVGQAGSVRITASSDGLASGQTSVTTVR
jgi:beta-galactosidase